MCSNGKIVELDAPDTWPASFRADVERLAQGSSDDQWFSTQQESDAVEHLRGHRLRAFHCTRLTPREVLSIRTEGLRVLEPSLVGARLINAVADGHLTEQQAAFYGETRLPSRRGRAGFVCLFADLAALRQPHQVGHPLTTWGGEGIYMALDGKSEESLRLEQVGTPTVIIAALDVAQHYASGSPGILSAAVQRLRGGEGATVIRSVITVAPAFIEAAHQPGTEFWNSNVWTPAGGFR